MPARTRKIRHDDLTRQRIKVANIITRLEKLIAGQIEMAPHAVTAALGLLRKRLPDMTSVDHSGAIETSYVARLPDKAKTVPAWQEQNAPSPTIQ